MAFSAATTSPAITSAKGCPHRGPSRSIVLATEQKAFGDPGRGECTVVAAGAGGEDDEGIPPFQPYRLFLLQRSLLRRALLLGLSLGAFSSGLAAGPAAAGSSPGSSAGSAAGSSAAGSAAGSAAAGSAPGSTAGSAACSAAGSAAGSAPGSTAGSVAGPAAGSAARSAAGPAAVSSQGASFAELPCANADAIMNGFCLLSVSRKKFEALWLQLGGGGFCGGWGSAVCWRERGNSREVGWTYYPSNRPELTYAKFLSFFTNCSPPSALPPPLPCRLPPFSFPFFSPSSFLLLLQTPLS